LLVVAAADQAVVVVLVEFSITRRLPLLPVIHTQ
jgi:hypothetical protein